MNQDLTPNLKTGESLIAEGKYKEAYDRMVSAISGHEDPVYKMSVHAIAHFPLLAGFDTQFVDTFETDKEKIDALKEHVGFGIEFFQSTGDLSCVEGPTELQEEPKKLKEDEGKCNAKFTFEKIYTLLEEAEKQLNEDGNLPLEYKAKFLNDYSKAIAEISL